MIVGGVGKLRPADAEVHGMVEHIKPILEGRLGERLETLAAVNYRSQCVAGTNYFINLNAGKDRHIHVRVYQKLDGSIELAAHQDGHRSTDVVDYFS